MWGKYVMESSQPLTLIGRVRAAIRYKHYSIRTECSYVEWVRRFVAFHGRKHPREMGAGKVKAKEKAILDGKFTVVVDDKQPKSTAK